MSLLSPLLAYFAGVLTILSPCVLPLAPIIAGSAMAQHRFGPIALALGLAASFSLVGLFVATIGFTIGVDNEVLRVAGAMIMLAAGAVLVAPPLQTMVAQAAGPVTAWATARTATFEAQGLLGQAALGALLGLVWAPCVGPTLGAASVLAAQGESLLAVTLIMALFGLGAATALIAFSYGAKALLARGGRARLHKVGESGKTFLGAALILVALLILTGADKIVEATLLNLSPAWLTELTTRL